MHDLATTSAMAIAGVLAVAWLAWSAIAGMRGHRVAMWRWVMPVVLVWSSGIACGIVLVTSAGWISLDPALQLATQAAALDASVRWAAAGLAAIGALAVGISAAVAHEDALLSAHRVSAGVLTVLAGWLARGALHSVWFGWQVQQVRGGDMALGWWVQDLTSLAAWAGWATFAAAALVGGLGVVSGIGPAVGPRFSRGLLLTAPMLLAPAVADGTATASVQQLVDVGTNSVLFDVGPPRAKTTPERRLRGELVRLDQRAIGDVIEHRPHGWRVIRRRWQRGWTVVDEPVNDDTLGDVLHPLVVVSGSVSAAEVLYALPRTQHEPVLLLRSDRTEFTLPTTFSPLQYTLLALPAWTGGRPDHVLDAQTATYRPTEAATVPKPIGPVPVDLGKANFSRLWRTCAGLALNPDNGSPTGRWCAIVHR